MTDLSREEFERLSSVLTGLYSVPRLALLFGLHEGREVADIVDDLDISRPGLQKNIEAMIDAELVYRPSDSDSPYELTPIGHEWVEILDEEADDLFTVLDQVEREEEQVHEQLELGDLPVDEKEIERAIHTRKWERLIDD